MRIIALMNQKGGVGKTTTTVNLGAALAAAGRRVCMIDLDPQAHMTIHYGVEPGSVGTSIYHVLIDETPLAQAVRRMQPNLDLVPSGIDLAAAEVELAAVLGRELRLREALENAVAGGLWDYVLIDCPPSLGLLTINALSAAGEVIIPMQAHFLAMQGVAKLLETIRLVGRRMNPGLRVSGVVLTLFDPQTKLTGEVVAELRQFIQEAAGKPLPWATARVFETRIRRNIKLAESPGFGQTIFAYDANSHGASDYRALAAEVMGMDGLVAVKVAAVVEAEKPAVVAAVKPVKVARPKVVPTRVAPVAVPQRVEVGVAEVMPERLAAAKANGQAKKPQRKAAGLPEVAV